MRNQLDTLLVELKKLKKNGVSSLLMEEDTLDLLQERAKACKKDLPEKEKTPQIPTQPLSEKQVELIPPDKGIASPVAPSMNKDFHSIPEVSIPQGKKQEQWEWLREKVLSCPVCNNHIKPGKKVVFGAGSIDADIFFCGEAPGAEEEIQGVPFVGPAGQLLTRVIQAMGLSRQEVYIGNIMNWRPETDSPYGNRPPTQEELAFCLPYLRAQVQIVQPKIIVALGATAVNGLLGYDPKRSITRSRGQWSEFEKTPTIITFHPSYVLRNGTNKVKRQIWEDMLTVMEKLSSPISEKQRGYFL
jgi:uracil-DNA glycosylase